MNEWLVSPDDPAPRVIVCGDRHWPGTPTGIDIIRDRLRRLDPATIVIYGGCRGADTIGAWVAAELGLRCCEAPADWRRYGRAAGPIRNQRMLDAGRPWLVIAFHPDITHSRGTADMVDRAAKAGVQVEVHGWPMPPPGSEWLP